MIIVNSHSFVCVAAGWDKKECVSFIMSWKVSAQSRVKIESPTSEFALLSI